MILLDTGPLVALLSADDQFHARVCAAFEAIREPMVTTWPVITEAMHLLRGYPGGQSALWELLVSDFVETIHLHDEDKPRLRDLMEKFRDTPMDLADASLVLVAERERIRRVFTLDRRGFTVFRAQGIGPLELLP